MRDSAPANQAPADEPLDSTQHDRGPASGVHLVVAGVGTGAYLSHPAFGRTGARADQRPGTALYELVWFLGVNVGYLDPGRFFGADPAGDRHSCRHSFGRKAADTATLIAALMPAASVMAKDKVVIGDRRHCHSKHPRLCDQNPSRWRLLLPVGFSSVESYAQTAG